MTDPAALMEHAALIAGLRDPAAYPHAVDAVEVIETHISSVLLAGAFAYKVKKPVDLGFLDFTSLERRRRYCEEELRLNRRGAPQLYLDVVPITGTPRAPRLGTGAGPAIEYAVRMRRFPAGMRLDEVARTGRLTGAHIDRLAEAIAAYHARAAPAPSGSGLGTPEMIWRWAQDNLASLEAGVRGPGEARRVGRLRAWSEAEFARRAGLFEQRRSTGRVRECHGDLHLGNLVLIDGEPVPFDCIEFNIELRFIDVLSDVAFAFMDLLDHRLAPLAWRFLSAYLERSGDYEGLATTRFYAVYRALVRAKIAMIRRGQPDADAGERAAGMAALRRYIAVALALCAPSEPRLVLTTGLSGSGKTTVAGMLCERMGAVRLRSDLERKRLYGVAPGDHAGAAAALEAGLYDPDATRRTYARLAELAAAALDDGVSVVVDAAFLLRGQREPLLALARARGLPCNIVECVASPATLRARVQARLEGGADPSDATLSVLEHQVATRDPLSSEEASLARRVDTDVEPGALQSWCARLAREWSQARATGGGY
jgi:hypothetical protein